MYRIYLNDVLFPIAPEKINTKIKNQNKTVTLISGDEVSLIKTPGLSEFEFSLLLPNVLYPFALYPNGFKKSDYYLRFLSKLQSDKKPINFKIIKKLQNDEELDQISMITTLEGYELEESSSFEILVKINLKEFKTYGLKQIVVRNEKEIIENKKRIESPEFKKPQSYKVKKGDTLWAIAKKYYDDGSKYKEIAKANNIKNPNLIFINQIITIP